MHRSVAGIGLEEEHKEGGKYLRITQRGGSSWIIMQGDNTVKFIYGNTFRYGTRGLWVPGSNGMGNSEILCFETTLLR